jgi:hypothetical protein
MIGVRGTLAREGQARWIYEYGDYLVFDTEFFFLFLLPPIIFEVRGFRGDLGLELRG